ncbi:hypothetical protein ACN20G_33485 (plasmid) [Streptomyces sp. BI20]|uniref:hypothetical protein n=1 Tax=Streptomyces sp. BI20 TaxID=3403460 RepID=UPI003C751971
MPRHLLPAPSTVLGHRRDGRPIFPVLGASSEDPSNDDAAEPQVTIGQARLQQMMTREKDQGARAGSKALVERLGFGSAAELEQWITGQRDAEASRLSEVERREQQLADRESAAARREAAAVARERQAARRAALAGVGAAGDDLADAEALLRVPDDADETTLAEAVTDLKARRPELFHTAPAAVPPAPAGGPVSGPPTRPGGQAPRPGAAGLDMARRRGLITGTG